MRGACVCAVAVAAIIACCVCLLVSATHSASYPLPTSTWPWHACVLTRCWHAQGYAVCMYCPCYSVYVLPLLQVTRQPGPRFASCQSLRCFVVFHEVALCFLMDCRRQAVVPLLCVTAACVGADGNLLVLHCYRIVVTACCLMLKRVHLFDLSPFMLTPPHGPLVLAIEQPCRGVALVCIRGV